MSIAKKKIAKQISKFHFDPFGKEFKLKLKVISDRHRSNDLFSDPMDTVGDDCGLSTFYGE